MNLTTVMYHYVRDLKNSKYPEIKGLNYHEFINQLDYLEKNYTFINIHDCFEQLDNKNNILPHNPVLLTFDDGYIDHYKNVFPILHKKKIQGVFFPPAEVVVENKVLDVHKIHHILAVNKKLDDLLKEFSSLFKLYSKEYKLESEDYYFKKLAYSNKYDRKEIIYFKRMLQHELPKKLRKKIVSDLFAKYVSNDEQSFSKELYMSNENLKEMKENNMIIGGHGYSHLWHENLSLSQQEDEIKLTLNFLNSLNVKTKDWVMCYPYGSYNKDTIDILQKYQCKMSFTTNLKLTNLVYNNRFTLERLDTNQLPK